MVGHLFSLCLWGGLTSVVISGTVVCYCVVCVGGRGCLTCLFGCSVKKA